YHEFPPDFFTSQQRSDGAIIIHVLVTIYMFYALAVVCNDYFIASLEECSLRLNLSDDVAGATFMAAGSSAPELFTAVLGVFVAKGDVGTATIVGSAVFNVLFVIGICGIFAGRVIILNWWPLFRDSSYYALTVVVLIIIIYDNTVSWYESLIMLIFYVIYILLLKFNTELRQLVSSKVSFLQEDQTAAINIIPKTDNKKCYSSYVPFNDEIDECAQTTVTSQPVRPVDESIRDYHRRISMYEAALMIMMTRHFRPSTRFRSAFRRILLEQRRIKQESTKLISQSSVDPTHILRAQRSISATSATFLGLTYDSELTWKNHITRMTNKVWQRANYIRRLSGKNIITPPEDVIKNIVTPPEDVIKNIVTPPEDIIKNIVPPPEDIIKNIVTPPEDIIKNIVTPPEDIIKNIITPPEDVIKNIVTPPEDIIKNIVTPPEDIIKNIITPPEDIIKNIITPPEDIIKNIITPPEDIIKNIVTPPEDIIKNIVTPLEDIVKNIITPPEDIIKNIVTPPEDITKNIVTPPEDIFNIYKQYISPITATFLLIESESPNGDVLGCMSGEDGLLFTCQWLVQVPVLAALHYTIPDCKKPQWKRWFLLGFFLSVTWIAVFSYIMVWMVTLIGFTMGIPDSIMGLTFLAAGTSVPDAFASLLVAKQGQGDMAVSNSMGSNVFDILIGLAIPWFIQTAMVKPGSLAKIDSKGLVYSVVLLFLTIIITIYGIYKSNWQLTRRLGMLALGVYFIFLFISIMLEFNVVGTLNPLMCPE
ncbi:sodium/potassium/calcium exchanger 4-like, partial [Limulus polyphemus]|uniref:Sodium/potassium/calcium exchanger 4-like n=1 Tax=Limulus polyphemus TaxID=6850 RepID=A0ABM1TGM4_LIMPO